VCVCVCVCERARARAYVVIIDHVNFFTSVIFAKN